jgi:hypothetical protein
MRGENSAGRRPVLDAQGRLAKGEPPGSPFKTIEGEPPYPPLIP